MIVKRENHSLYSRGGSAVLGIALAPLLPLLLVLALLCLSVFVISRLAVFPLIWILWLPRGKDTLFIYSDSPIWREYMTNEVLPLISERAVVLNWSERRTWNKWSLATWAFHTVSGPRNYNPMVVMFRPLRSPRTFRFWSAFQESKHGNTGSVERLKEDLRATL